MENEKSDLTLLGRSTLTVTGVQKIKSSEPGQVVLVLGGVQLVVGGENLTITNASRDSGVVEITGLVGALKYTGAAKKKFSVKNMFR